MRTHRFAGTAIFLAVALPCFSQIKIDAVVNAASGTSSLAPGTWAAIYGSNLAAGSVAAQSVPFPATLGDVQVTVAGKPAPLSYVSPTQINVLIPFEAATLNPGQTATVPLVVTRAAESSAPFNLLLTRSAPAIFTKNTQGFGPALAFDASFREISTVGTGPIVLYATGLGPTVPPGSSFSTGATVEPLNRLLDGLSVTVGDTVVLPSFVGLAPFLHGIYQINFTPPSPQPAPISLHVGGMQSNLATLLIPAGTNTKNVTGTIEGAYPASGPFLAGGLSGGSSVPKIAFSAMYLGAYFQVSFDVVAGAKPFSVVARGPAGGTTIDFDPSAGTYSGSSVVPKAAARVYDFSTASFAVVDFVTCVNNSCRQFPGNIVPASRLDPSAVKAIAQVRPADTFDNGPNGRALIAGSIPSDRHFAIGPAALGELMWYGGFINLTHNPGTAPATFDLYVDNVPVATKTVTYIIQ